MTLAKELLETARAAARAAAVVHARHAGQVDVTAALDKGRSDFVSAVDVEAQRAALSLIRRMHPQHAIIAEEDDEGQEGLPSNASEPGVPLWIVDPLDGTSNYLHGHPMYAASVGVALDGVVLAGAVLASATREEWWAARGAGAFKNGQPIHVSGTHDLNTALVGTGFPFKALDGLPLYLEQFSRVLRGSAGIRRGGSAAMDLCYLAQGSLDAFWETTLSPWDVAAGTVILEEAGGSIRRIEGGELDTERAGSVLAANSPELLAALDGVVFNFRRRGPGPDGRPRVPG